LAGPLSVVARDGWAPRAAEGGGAAIEGFFLRGWEVVWGERGEVCNGGERVDGEEMDGDVFVELLDGEKMVAVRASKREGGGGFLGEE